MYKGYKNYESWNVAFYINNDYKLYWQGQVALKTCNSCVDRAVDIFLAFINASLGKDAKTDDGVAYTKENCREYFDMALNEEEVIRSRYAM